MLARLLILTLLLLNSIATAVHAVDAMEADVVVYGSTPSGCCAAIAAAREGASVILLEPTGHVGGVNTGGLSFSDSNQTVRSTVMGLFDEWHRRIEQDYQSRNLTLPYQVSVKDQARWTYEPHVASRVTRQMLDEAKVEVLTKCVLQSVTKNRTRISTLVTSSGIFSAKVFIDATYEGDLMAAAGVDWTIGREGRTEFDESLAGRRYPKGKMPISGFDKDGEMLPLITTAVAGPDEDGDRNVMTYSFRLCMTAEPSNRVPMPEPASYDPTRFEVVRWHLHSGGRGVGFDLYELPGGKFDGNNSIGGQFSLGLVGACNGWSEASPAERVAIWEAHRQYTLEFYKFLTTDIAVPEATRRKFARLGLCKDEFLEHGHWPPQLYVREGRRMRGMYVVSQKDILDDPEKEDPIVVSSFPIDSHDCQRIALNDGVINEGTIFPVRMKGHRHGYPYHIPYRAILPKPDQCSNLLVPVALSCTHVALSSIRVEPTWMILGQSAGIAAALAARNDVPVQALDYSQLRELLLAQKQVLELPELPPLPPPAATAASIDPGKLSGIVLDDATAELKGTWALSTNFKPYIGESYVHDERRGDGLSIATFCFKAPKGGRYQLGMAYSAHETRATKVPVVVTSGRHIAKLTVDQTQPLPTGQAFRNVGSVELANDVETIVTISNQNTNGFVILDALQLTEAAPQREEADKNQTGLLPADWNPKLAGDTVMSRLVQVTAPQVKGAHDAEIVIVNRRAYIVAEVNDALAGENPAWPEMYCALSIVNLDTLAVESVIPVARSEQPFENVTLPVGACFVPRIVQKDARTLRCYFASEQPGQRQAQTWFRDFDLSTRNFAATIHKAQLKTAAGTFDMQPKYFHADAAAHGFKKPAKDYGLYLIDSFKRFDGKTHVALNSFPGKQNALALLHDDFATFEVVGHFNEPQSAQLSESSVNRLPDGSWMAICRNDGGNYYFTTSRTGKAWTTGKELPVVPSGANSKPTFDRFGDEYFLGWQERTRIDGVNRSVFNIDISRDGRTWKRKYLFETTKSFQYPTFCEHDGVVWLCVTQGDSSPSRKERIMFGQLEHLGDFAAQQSDVR